jgi:hypothetical protein
MIYNAYQLPCLFSVLRKKGFNVSEHLAHLIGPSRLFVILILFHKLFHGFPGHFPFAYLSKG